MGIENGLRGLPKKTEKEIKQSREESDKQLEQWADVHNKKRGVIKKTLGMGKMSGVDMAHEEALHTNKIFDTDRSMFEAEEFIRAQNPAIVKNIQDGEINAALRGVYELAQKMESKERDTLYAALRKMETDQVNALIKSDDLPGMKKILSKNRLDEVSIANIALMPKEILSLPEIQEKFTDRIKSDYQFSIREGNLTFVVGRAKELADAGLMSQKAVDAVFASEEMQNLMRAKIKSDLMYGIGNGNLEFVDYTAKQLMDAGLMNRKAVEAVFASEEARKLMVEKIKDRFRYRINDPEFIARGAKQFVDAVLMNQKVVDAVYASEEIQNLMREEIKNTLRYSKADGAKRKAQGYVDAGLMKNRDAQAFLAALDAR